MELCDSTHHLLAFGFGEAHVLSGLTHVFAGLGFGLLPEFVCVCPELLALGGGEAHVFPGLTHEFAGLNLGLFPEFAGLCPEFLAFDLGQPRAFRGLARLLSAPRLSFRARSPFFELSFPRFISSCTLTLIGFLRYGRISLGRRLWCGWRIRRDRRSF